MDNETVKEPFMPSVGDEVILVNNWIAGTGQEFKGQETILLEVIHKTKTVGRWKVIVLNPLTNEKEVHYVRFDSEIVAWVTTMGE